MSSTSLKAPGTEVITSPKTKSPVSSSTNSSTKSLNQLAKQEDKLNKAELAALRSNSKEEEICDDWEQLDQQKIEKSLQSIKISNRSNYEEEKTLKSDNNQSSTTAAPFNNQFPAPSIKILKRPASNKKMNDMSGPNQSSVTQPIKTFEQREQEYAQARLRILGSAHPEEESSSTSSNNNSSGNKNNQINQNYNNNSNINYNNHTSNQTNNNNRQAFNVIRDPIAPDGTKGFRNYTNKSF